MKKNLIAAMILLSVSFSSPIYAIEIIQPMTDTVNSGIINTQMIGNDAYSNVNATVENGVAIFSGVVPTKEDADKLVLMGHSVSGVRGVDISRLRIK